MVEFEIEVKPDANAKILSLLSFGYVFTWVSVFLLQLDAYIKQQFLLSGICIFNYLCLAVFFFFFFFLETIYFTLFCLYNYVKGTKKHC